MGANSDQIRAFVTERVRTLAREKGEAPEALDDDYNLMDSGLFDSVAFIQLITDVEETFDVELNFDDLDPEEFTSLGGLLRCAAL